MSLSLPIDTLLPEIVRTIERNTLTLLEAEPGAGKTTRVPPALLASSERTVIVLEPRRLAARLAARRVAEEMQCALGETVGYQVRFERAGSDATRLWYVTEGVLIQRLLRGQTLPRNAVVVLDEFHERHLETDLALALLRRLLPERPDLRIVLMSATLGAEALASQLGTAIPVLRASGRVFPVEVMYTPASSEALEQQVANAVRQALAATRGHVLVFLPGAAEIRAAMRVCSSAIGNDVLVLPLHGDLSPEEQDAAIASGSRRKVICSTNVAESSVTIEGVSAVVDSGLARILSHSPWSGFARLEVTRVSRSSCIQRAGRAGRTGPGLAIRLFSAEDFARRPQTAAPEIVRADLAQALLDTRTAGIDFSTLPWLDAPPAAAIAHAHELLQRLGKLRPAPVHPRLTALVLKAAELGNAEEGCDLAAKLSGGRGRWPDVESILSSELTFAARKTKGQLRELARAIAPPVRTDKYALEKAILFAFSDRVGQYRGQRLSMSGGGSAQLDRAYHAVGEFAVAMDVDDRSDAANPMVRLAVPIEAEWLLDMFPDCIEEVDELRWNRADERVEQVQQWRYGKVTVDETVTPPRDLDAAAEFLVAKCAEAGLERWTSDAETECFLERVRFAAESSGEAVKPQELVRGALRQVAQGCTSFAQMREAGKRGALLSALQAAADQRLLQEFAPAYLTLPSGRRARIDYTAGQPPSVSSRLQDFIGLKQTPTVARGAIPLTLCLLAPNNRPVQVTSDLTSFWKTLYPQLRRELSRRYPRHSWPENPG